MRNLIEAQYLLRIMTMNILVAEDSRSYALLYEKSLQCRGHQITITRDGMKCLYHYIDNFKKDKNGEFHSPYDVVLLDHKLPRMNGLDVAKEILDTNPKQRILIVSAHVEAILDGIKKLKGKVEFLNKPFPSFAMVRQVEGLSSFKFRQKFEKGLEKWDGFEGLSEPI